MAAKTGPLAAATAQFIGDKHESTSARSQGDRIPMAPMSRVRLEIVQIESRLDRDFEALASLLEAHERGMSLLRRISDPLSREIRRYRGILRQARALAVQSRERVTLRSGLRWVGMPNYRTAHKQISSLIDTFDKANRCLSEIEEGHGLTGGRKVRRQLGRLHDNARRGQTQAIVALRDLRAARGENRTA